MAAVELWPGLEEYATAFNELSAGRGWAGGGLGAAYPLPIAEVEIEAYARMMGHADDRERLIEFRTLIKAQDATWMTHFAEQRAGTASTTSTASDKPTTQTG